MRSTKPPPSTEGLSGPDDETTSAELRPMKPLSESQVADVDALIPAPWPMWARVLTLLALVAGVGFIVNRVDGGHVYPRPAQRGQDDVVWISSDLFFDRTEGLAGVSFSVLNGSERALRLSDLQFDIPGAELVTSVRVPETRTDPGDVLRDALLRGQVDPLPMELPGQLGARYSFYAWFRPVQCEDTAESWGSVEATLDFGGDGLPWTSRTFSSRPLWQRGETLSGRNAMTGNVAGGGPLTMMCEELR